jgi:small-conductance mechanosensitive channel
MTSVADVLDGLLTTTDVFFKVSAARYTFSVGDYVVYRDGYFGRVDHIFVHE